MELFFGLLLLVLTLCFVAVPILAILVFVRLRRLEQRAQQTDRFEQRLTSVEAELVALRRRAAAPSAREPTPAPPTPVAEPKAPAPPEPPVAAERPRSAQAPKAVEPLRPPAVEELRPTPPHPPARPARTSRLTTEAPEPVSAPSGDEAPPSPPPSTPTGPPAARPPSRPFAAVDWERWIGIRGAAVLGAVALGLAGLLFFKYSIERGLITPAMRVVFGTLTGLGCLVGSEWLRKRDYRVTAEAIAGAGVVILYAAFWAAHVLYGLIGMTFAFGLMVLVTLACCLLALRRSSLLVAVLGLVGGFATPLLLSTGSDRPIGLFGYVLMLDLALLTIGHKRRWPSLGVISLLATVLLQALWIGARMGPDRLLLGLAILAVFAVLFVVSGSFAPAGKSHRTWLWSQIGAVLFPFVFTVYFAARVELGPHLYPIAILLALLCAAAGWLARRQRVYTLGVGAATASVVVVAVWLLQHSLTTALAWETVAVTVGLAVLFHAFVEYDPEPHGIASPAPAALAAAGGFFLLQLVAAVPAPVPPWPWVAGWVALAGLLYRHAEFPQRGVLQFAAAIGLGLGLSGLHLAHAASVTFPPPLVFLALLVAVALALQAVVFLRREPLLRAFSDQAAAVLPVLLLVGLAPSPFTFSLGPLPALGTALVLGVLAILAATRLANGLWYAAAVGATLLVHLGWTSNRAALAEHDFESLAGVVIEALAVIVFSLWPLLAAKRFSAARVAWYAAALAGPLWFSPLRRLFVWTFGDGFIGVLPVALGALSLAAAFGARKVLADTEPLRRSALVWFAAVSLCFFAVAIPLQLEKEWITIGWALEGLAMIALWKRLDHPGLKYFGLALLGMATVRLVANPALLGYYSRSSLRIVNWLLYTYIVPAAALLGSAALLKPLEPMRVRAWELPFYKGRPIGAIGAGLAAIVVIFVWINLAIADWFASGPLLTLSFGDRPAQRLTVSIAWAIYALVLLGFGMGRNSLGLRWLSLGFLLITIGKVFLYDLGALRDLYRVASLVGLAASLILVSLLYQRFVFRKNEAERT